MSLFNSLWSGEVSDEVQQTIERFELGSKETRDIIERKAAQIRSRAEAEVAGLQQKADEAIRAQADALVRDLAPLLAEALRSGRMGEVLAVSGRLRTLRTRLFDVLPDPGKIYVKDEDYGKSFHYEVTAATDLENAYVYGTDIYTSDCDLAGCCVHAGILRPGETGIVKVTVLAKPYPSFEGSEQNGVASKSWDGDYPAFRVSLA